MSDWEAVNAENLVRHKYGTYYLSAKVGGKKIRKSLGTKSLSAAKLKRDTKMAELRAKAGTMKQGGGWTLKEAIAATRAYYATLPSYQAKPKSLQYRNEMLDLLQRTLPNRAVQSWNAADMVKWWTSEDVTGYCAQRRNNALGTLRKLIELATETGAILSDPTANLQRVRIPKTHIKLPPRGSLALIVADIRGQGQANSEEAANMVEFLAYSGCRIGECRAVKWEDIETASITITGGEGLTKSHEWRKVPIVPAMALLLKRMRTPDSKGQIFKIFAPRHALENACKRLKLSHMRVHDLRHLFATQCIESGVDIPTVAKWLGHKDGGALAMRVYGHLRDEHSQAAALKVVF